MKQGTRTPEEEGYLRFFEQNPFPMWIYDLDTLSFLTVNRAALEHYGYSRDEFLAMTIADIRPKEDVPSLLENILTVGEDIDHAGVWRHLTKDGTVIHVEITSYPLDFKGAPMHQVVDHSAGVRGNRGRRLCGIR